MIHGKYLVTIKMGRRAFVPMDQSPMHADLLSTRQIRDHFPSRNHPCYRRLQFISVHMNHALLHRASQV